MQNTEIKKDSPKKLTSSLIIISGRSGSGKSVVLQTLEDLQYYCVDNLPLNLLNDLLLTLSEKRQKIAVSIDARNLDNNSVSYDELIRLTKSEQARFIYLDAPNETLLRRFKETRRKHPLTSENISLTEALNLEEEMLEPLKNNADLNINTGDKTAQQLRSLTLDFITPKENNTLSLQLLSFGFKHGLPQEADFIFDARCLPNPYWDTTLRTQNGTDAEVISFLDNATECQDMLSDIATFFNKWIKSYQKEQRRYLTIAIGCTGGQHRSVYLINKLAVLLRQNSLTITIRHRDLSSS